MDELLRDEEGFRTEMEGSESGDGRPQSRRRAQPASDGRRVSSNFREWAFSRKRRPSVSSLERIESADASDEAEADHSSLKKIKSASSSKDHAQGDSRKYSMLDFDGLRRRLSMNLEDSSDPAASVALSQGATLKKRMVHLYVELCGLRSFVQLNKTGFSKILKKYDKTVDRNLRPKYMSEVVEKQHSFKKETVDQLNDRITQVEQAYATTNTGGNLEQARRELRLDLREHVVWERNTVWRDMIGIERKAQAANLGIRRTILESGNARKQGDEQDEVETKEVTTPLGRYRCPTFIFHSTFYTLILILAVFFVLVFVPILELPEQQNCLAMVVTVSLLWATEVSNLGEH